MMSLAALFASRFEKSAQRVRERLGAYMAEPENEEKLHDVSPPSGALMRRSF